MAEAFDSAAMVTRFQERAAAVRRRGLPPVEGSERQRILEQMQLDYMDFAMLGDATASLEEGILTLRIDLRPPDAAEGAASAQGATSGASGAGPGPSGGPAT